MKFKPWEELTIADDFMFCKIMSNEEICTQMLEFMLGVKISRLVYHEPQKSIDLLYESRGIRMDVYVADSDRVFDVEMQTSIKPELPKRTRYYQSLIDIDTLKKGDLYTSLKESFIIFICAEDPFKLNRSHYTFHSWCDEDKDFALDDKTTKVFYNVNEYEKEANPEVRALLELLKRNKPTNDFTDKIQHLVDDAKNQNEKWRADYMTLDMIRKEEHYLGIEEGKKFGMEEGKKFGMEQGQKLGARDNALENARNAVMLGLSVKQIAAITGLSEDEINSIAEGLKK